MTTFPFPRYRLLQFAKAPVQGTVKTRMAPHLSDAACAELHRALTRQVFTNLLEAKMCPQELWVGSEHPFFSELTSDSGVPIFTQVEGDLGVRMAAAAKTALSCDQVDGVILVGSDCPFINQAYLSQAIGVLKAGQDVVVGPANDGGYVLLGMSRLNSLLFEGIDWGTERVAGQTLQILKRLGWNYQLLSSLPDIDRPEDLALLSSLGVAI